MKTLLRGAALLMCFVARSSSQGTAPHIRVSEDIEAFRITDNSYVYVSYFELPPWGRVPSNGLVHISDGEALLFDTPMSDSLTRTLVTWIVDSLKVSIKGLIANHWHEDCIGGLRYIKSIGIPSYANEKTIAIAGRKGRPVPDHSFRDSLTLRVGKDSVLSRYFGAAHTTDNIVSWIPSERILFGGCMVRELSTTSAGNTEDADLAAWPLTIGRVITAYPAAGIVIPGHGAIGGTDLLRHTQDLLASIAGHGPSQIPGGGGDAHPALKTNAASLAHWEAMRFGMFIHWGPVTLRGTEIGWSRGPEVPIAEYDDLYREFNPVLFNAASWIGTAKAAGMKYLVIVAKHHDGFCLWDTKYTDYKITSGPFRRDVVRELSDECARQGVMFCTYYSILDWHHPDYTTRYGGDTRPVLESGMDRYRGYLKNQIRELVSDYHSNLLWFDGQWERSWTHADGMELYSYARGLNDALLINNRVDKGRGRPPRESDTVSYAGDFGTPEQEIGGLDNAHPWESCITIGKQWAWRPNDTLKTLNECIHILAKTAGSGGNLLLNISPMPDGRIEKRQTDILMGIGTWLDRYGESIYGTRGGPYRSASWLASTHKGNRIYVHLLTLPGTEVLLPALPGRSVKSARLLGAGEMRLKMEDGKLKIALPAKPDDANDTVIVLELDGPADTITPLDVPAMSLN